MITNIMLSEADATINSQLFRPLQCPTEKQSDALSLALAEPESVLK